VAVEKPDVSIQDQLINHPKADLKLKNEKEFNVIQLATLKNNFKSVLLFFYSFNLWLFCLLAYLTTIRLNRFNNSLEILSAASTVNIIFRLLFPDILSLR